MTLIRWILVVIHFRLQWLAVLVIHELRQACHGHAAGRIGDLAALVQKYRRILVPKDLFCTFLVIEATKPYLGTIGKSHEEIRLVQFIVCIREYLGHYSRESVIDDGLLDMPESEPQDSVPGTFGTQRPGYNRCHQQERLARSGATGQ